MRLVAYALNKLKIEKYENISKELKINTSINLESIEESKNELLKVKDVLLNIKFKYKIIYDPKFAEIEFEGNMGVLTESKKAKEVIKNQKTDKLDEEFKLFVFNMILRKCNIKALQLEEELNLPPHFNLPSLKSGKKE